MVQEKIADSYAAIRMLRLFVLETAWKIDNTSTQETRTDIAAVKYTMAKVLREVSYNALHILGSLGTTDLTPNTLSVVTRTKERRPIVTEFVDLVRAVLASFDGMAPEIRPLPGG